MPITYKPHATLYADATSFEKLILIYSENVRAYLITLLEPSLPLSLQCIALLARVIGFATSTESPVASLAFSRHCKKDMRSIQ
jgi:hypothetical protein